MKDLAYYKGAKIQLQDSLRQAKNKDYRAELSKAIRFIVRRIEQIERRVLVTAVLLAVLVMLSGCSGGGSVSFGVGGSIHNPSHDRLPEIIRETPIIKTTTEKSWGLSKYWSEK